jgi:hypothetical protein
VRNLPTLLDGNPKPAEADLAAAGQVLQRTLRVPASDRSPPVADPSRERTAMLQLDYALLCDYVRAEGGVAHVIAARIDTIYRPEVPAVANLGFLARFTFTDDDLRQAHQLELRLTDQEGQQVAQITGSPPLQAVQGLPDGWLYGGIVALNFGAPLPSHGPYTLTILLDETPVKTINLRVIPPEAPSGPTG